MQRVVGTLSVVCLVLASFWGMASAAQNDPGLRERMIAAEDGRAQASSDLGKLREGLGHIDPRMRQQAVRGIGRLERADLIATLTRALADVNADVRMEAANAVGQSAKGEQGVAAARTRLLTRARIEQDPRVWGAVAATLGRLAYTTATDVDAAERTIARVLPSASATAIQIDALSGAVEGLEALVRQSGKISKLKPATLDGLRAAAALEGRATDAEKLARIRRLATLTLTAAGGVTRPQLEVGARDADAEVRRLTMIAARAVSDGREQVLRTGLADANGQVRFDALQSWGRELQKQSCDPIVQALDDRDPHVAMLAIDLLGSPCGDRTAAIAGLTKFTGALDDRPRTWHRPAHAIVALARIAPEDARALLPRYGSHATWQVRMYAARAAGALSAVDDLQRLARDPHHNVRQAALGELSTLQRPEVIPLAIEALSSTDYQLVMTAARALGKSADEKTAVPALSVAFARIEREQRDTSRDARTAIADALRALGAKDVPSVVIPPPVSTRVTAEQLRAAQASRLRLTMSGLGHFDLRLLTDEAPVTALHIAALASKGYFNGLTFHRVAPNFVIQGGSPGANEYAGQGPYMRDEVGLVSHRRGTVGISTRGRDTGDAQIFVNLVDSPRLDHTYTVFAEVVSGMDVVDAILEGDVIERVELIPQS